MDLQKTLQFLEVASKLKALPRTGWVQNHVAQPETVSGHCWRVALMAMMFHPDGINVDRCVKMGLVHDLAEAVIGDLTPSQIKDPHEKSRIEDQAFAELCALLPQENGVEILSLFREFEAGETPESRFVHELDKLEMVVQAHEYETAQHLQLPNFYETTIRSGMIRSELGNQLLAHCIATRPGGPHKIPSASSLAPSPPR